MHTHTGFHIWRSRVRFPSPTLEDNFPECLESGNLYECECNCAMHVAGYRVARRHFFATAALELTTTKKKVIFITRIDKSASDCLETVYVLCSKIMSFLRKHAVENGSTRRVDILAYNADTKQGIIVDPTILFEVECHHSAQVHLEKKSIYEPTVNYFKLKYALIHVEVFGLLIGARGTIPAFFEEYRRQFALPTSLRDDIVMIVLKNPAKS
ncbi:hypothetical protein ANN_09726 [Periplaneta americana]|uniref:Uncharacterized protein n=1 Tax=Periplaneta americana TaxID=6978 RepID=A0ABQ8TM36_PERAM|nr:hypothetical protein ANN_09726 [Periplaneta americana]